MFLICLEAYECSGRAGNAILQIDSAALTLTTALVCFLHPHPLHFPCFACFACFALLCSSLWAEPVGSTSGLDVSLATHTGRVCLLACVGILKVCDGSVIDHKQTIM
jgi:hypothetical protein